MKIVTLLGSPKKNGNTARVLNAFEEKAARLEHNVERVFLPELNINPCNGCMACQKSAEEPGCAQKDDAQQVFLKMIDADYILYATPLYFWNFSSQIRPIMDRHISLVNGYVIGQHQSLIQGKRAGLLVTCGGPLENNADIIKDIFKRFCAFNKTHPTENFFLPNCNSEDGVSEEAVQTLAFSMMTKICG